MAFRVFSMKYVYKAHLKLQLAKVTYHLRIHLKILNKCFIYCSFLKGAKLCDKVLLRKSLHMNLMIETICPI